MLTVGDPVQSDQDMRIFGRQQYDSTTPWIFSLHSPTDLFFRWDDSGLDCLLGEKSARIEEMMEKI